MQKMQKQEEVIRKLEAEKKEAEKRLALKEV